MAKKSCCPHFLYIIALIFFCLLLNVRTYAQLKGGSGPTLDGLAARFKEAAALPCGQRDEALRIGGEIVAGYDRINSRNSFIESAINEFRDISQQEKRCKLDNSEKTIYELEREFKMALNQPCGERDQALRLARDIIDRFGDDQSKMYIVDRVNAQFSVIEPEDKKCKEAISLETLFQEYKILRKQPCGERYKAIRHGKRIVDLYGGDESNQNVILYVEKDSAKITEQDRICRRNTLYDLSYENKNWNVFFAVSRQIIEEQGNSPLALDVMLTLVSVGYRLSAGDRRDVYTSDTLHYAKKAIDLIESGTRPERRWGVFEPFESMDKSLGWLNYVAGYMSYFRFKEGKKAIPYFYKATQYNSEFKHDAFVYQAVAIYYFDKAAVTTSSLTVNDFITKASGIGEVDESNVSPPEAAKNREIAMLYKQLVNLYNLRYNLAADENVTGLTDYILKLIDRPLIDTAASKAKYTKFGQTK